METDRAFEPSNGPFPHDFLTTSFTWPCTRQRSFVAARARGSGHRTLDHHSPPRTSARCLRCRARRRSTHRRHCLTASLGLQARAGAGGHAARDRRRGDDAPARRERGGRDLGVPRRGRRDRAVPIARRPGRPGAHVRVLRAVVRLAGRQPAHRVEDDDVVPLLAFIVAAVVCGIIVARLDSMRRRVEAEELAKFRGGARRRDQREPRGVPLGDDAQPAHAARVDRGRRRDPGVADGIGVGGHARPARHDHPPGGRPPRAPRREGVGAEPRPRRCARGTPRADRRRGARARGRPGPAPCGGRHRGRPRDRRRPALRRRGPRSAPGRAGQLAGERVAIRAARLPGRRPGTGPRRPLRDPGRRSRSGDLGRRPRAHVRRVRPARRPRRRRRRRRPRACHRPGVRGGAVRHAHLRADRSAAGRRSSSPSHSTGRAG